MELAFLAGPALTLAGCVTLYLASPHQGALRTSWPKVPARVIGGALLACSLAEFCRTLQALPAVFLLTACVMVFLVLLPYLCAFMPFLRSR